MEAKVRFTVVGVVEAVIGEEGGESFRVLKAMPADVAAAELRLEKDDILEIWGVEWLAEVTSGVLFGAGEGGAVDTVSDKGSDPSKWGGESVGSDMMWVDCGEEGEDSLGSVFVSVVGGGLSGWEGGAERWPETGEGGEGPSMTEHDPWVWTGVGVDGKSFSILPVGQKWG